MGLFGLGTAKGKSGGIMNVIRCDEPEYLVWKWRPEGQGANSTSRENSIRYGSSLRVKDGEVAVFVYKQKDGTMQDFIVGPYDDTIKTANFPILSSIVGLAFGGESPFQAEIYFINLQGNNQVKFAIPYFDVADPRLPDFPVPVAVRGAITFNMGQQMQNAMNTPPPMPTVQYMIAVNGQQTGPYNMQQLQQMVQMGQFTPQTYVWKQGMAQWELAGNVPELASLFAAPAPPPVPGGIPTPPMP